MKLSELDSILGLLRRNGANCEVVNSVSGLKVRAVQVREQELNRLRTMPGFSFDGSTVSIKIAPEKAMVIALRAAKQSDDGEAKRLQAELAQTKEDMAELYRQREDNLETIVRLEKERDEAIDERDLATSQLDAFKRGDPIVPESPMAPGGRPKLTPDGQ